MKFNRLVKKILCEAAPGSNRTIDDLGEHEQAVIMDVMRSNGDSIKSFKKGESFLDDNNICTNVVINNVPLTIWWHNTDTSAAIDQLARVLGFVTKDKGGSYLNQTDPGVLKNYKQKIAAALKDNFFGFSDLVNEIDVDFN